MITFRPSQDRGLTSLSWLTSRHTFSFGDYFDRKHMAFGELRVINDDIILGGGGFGLHPHRDMEIITYMIDGVLRHSDSMGNSAVLKAGDVQVMTAGSGLMHSEVNDSEDAPIHLLQIWVMPRTTGLPPAYADRTLPDTKGVTVIASPDGRDGSLVINQDMVIERHRLDDGQSIVLGELPKGRHWIHVVKGSLEVDGRALNAGDAAGITEGSATHRFAAQQGTEALVFRAV